MNQFYRYLVYRLSTVFRPIGIWGRWAPIGALIWLEAMLAADMIFIIRKLLGLHSRIENPTAFGVVVVLPLLALNLHVFANSAETAKHQKAFAHYTPRQRHLTDAFLILAFVLAWSLVLVWAS